MAKQKLRDQELGGFASMYDRYVNYVHSLSSSQRKSKLILAVVSIIVLAGGSSALSFIPLFTSEWGIWVQTIIAFPAGILAFAIFIGIQKTTKMNSWKISDFKENYSHRQRIKRVSISLVVIVALLIAARDFTQFIPYGLGGALMTALILTCYNLLRRTPQEIVFASQGIIDPRDINPDGTVPEAVANEAEYNATINSNQEQK